MQLLLFTRALVGAQHARFDATERPQAPLRAPRDDRAPRLRCVWSRGADGRLSCRWLRDGAPADCDAIPAEAIRRFPAPVPEHAPQRAPMPLYATGLRRIGNAPLPALPTGDRAAPAQFSRLAQGNDHVRHVRSA